MRSPISRFTVNGNSMKPTLNPGQDVLSFNWFINPKIGDIVVIKQDDKEMVKRVTKIDGRHILVKGDNEEESTDSRNFGPIGMDQIIGKVIYVDSRLSSLREASGNDMVDCPKCWSSVVGIYGRKDAICSNCGFKLTCCE